MTEEIAQLRDVGLVVYATTRNPILEGGVGVPLPWLVAYVVIRRNDDKSYPFLKHFISYLCCVIWPCLCDKFGPERKIGLQ